MLSYTRTRTCTYLLQYSIVYTTLFCNKILSDDVVEQLKFILNDVAKQNGLELISVKIEDKCQITCEVLAPPQMSPTNIAKVLKGVSGQILARKYPMFQRPLWNKSYFIETRGLGNKQEENKYIERQRRCQQ